MPDTQLSKIEYEMHLKKCYLLLSILDEIPLDVMDAMVNRAESFGMFVDPTLYIAKRAAMEQDHKTIKALLPAWNHTRAIKEYLAKVANGS